MKEEGEQYNPPGHNSNVIARSIMSGNPDVHITVFPPGAGMEQETHPNQAHVFYLLAGQMSVYQDGSLLKELTEGDAIYIPAGEAHEVKNNLQEPMRFLAVTFDE